MAETPPAPTATPTPPEPVEPPVERTVPYDRFKSVNDQLVEAKQKIGTFETKLTELEEKDKTELEQERSKRERAEAKLTELQGQVEELGGKLTSTERSQWVREAAAKANFHDPVDALGRPEVDLSKIETEDDAKKAVAEAVKAAKHLVDAEPTPPSVPGRVLAGGQPADPNAPDPAREEGEKFVQELKEASQRGWATSAEPLV